MPKIFKFFSVEYILKIKNLLYYEKLYYKCKFLTLICIINSLTILFFK